METERIEQPLRWPEGWPRTRFQDRKPQKAWARPYNNVVDALRKELKQLKATAWLITHNERSNQDSGVAVYFSLQAMDNYGWQEALGFVGEIPTVDQINRAYRERAEKVHPDRPGGDGVLFNALTKHRDRALAWARGTQTVETDKVFACDKFNEVRLNLNAIRLTIAALRQIERCGTSDMMERAFRGFNKQIGVGGDSGATAA